MSETTVSGPDKSTIGGRLEHARKLSGLSARRLALMCGFTGGHVGLIESGERGASRIAAHTVSALSRVLGVSQDWLLEGRGDEPTAEAVAAAVAEAETGFQVVPVGTPPPTAA